MIDELPGVDSSAKRAACRTATSNRPSMRFLLE
jgi:hypothetical protein